MKITCDCGNELYLQELNEPKVGEIKAAIEVDATKIVGGRAVILACRKCWRIALRVHRPRQPKPMSIRRLRHERGLSRASIANMVGVTVQAVAWWEKGERIPRLPALRKLADVLGVSPGMLLDGCIVDE